MLLVASYIFYGAWDYRFLSLILLSSLVDYWIGRRLGVEHAEARRRVLLACSVITNLGVLFVFKYFGFFTASLISLGRRFGIELDLHVLNVVLPVGISFYTFQTLSYTIDVFRRKIEPTNNALSFFTYVAFFPQLVAGPIERASRLLPQFETVHPFDRVQFVEGLRQILWGFFKKVVIADNVALYADAVFGGSVTDQSSFVLIAGVLAFSVQIYCDFSGYSDIAIGLSRLMGFNLMQNFNFPYFARDIADFWRRWHISLSTWFRDYVYIPLGGSRIGRFGVLRNVFIVFVVSGLWHGANWTFVAWGLFHAILFIPQVCFSTNRRYALGTENSVDESRFVHFLQIVVTFSLVCLAWIFFRAGSIGDAFAFIGAIFMNWTIDPVAGFSALVSSTPHVFVETILVVLLVGFLFSFEWLNREKCFALSMPDLPGFLRLPLYSGLLILVIEFFSGNSAFIYFQF